MSQDERIARGVLGVSASEVPKRLLVVATGSFKKGATSRLKKTKSKGRITTGIYQDMVIGVLDGGVGSPAATMIIEAAAKAEIDVLIRADFCGGLLQKQAIGDAFVAETVIVGDGCGSAYFGKGKRVPADDELTNALLAQSEALGLPAHRGTMWTTDILLRQTDDLLQEWIEQGAHAVDMETSSVLGIANESRIPAASINCISDLQLHGRPLFGPGGVDPLLLRGIDLVIDVAIHTLVEWR